MSCNIDPRAAISPDAQLGENVSVGPFAVIGPNVQIGDNCTIGPHVNLSGHTTIGKGTKIFVGANIGDEPQDLHFEGAESYTDIGEDCLIREYVTVHRGVEEGSHTYVGNRVMLMAFSHLGHNCQIADDVVIANASLLAGRVEVGKHAFISAQVMIHQFCHIGTYAMIGGGNAISQDIPPYCLLQFGVVRGLNAVGVRRAGFSAETRQALQAAIHATCFEGLSRPNAIAKIRQELPQIPEVVAFAEFLENSQRGIVPGLGTKHNAEA